MKILIVGAGTIGANLAKSLSEEDHEVYLVEGNKEVALKVKEKLDVQVYVGQGSDPNALERAGIREADLVIAVTNSDETNLVVCSLAAYFGVEKRIARVRSRSLNSILVDNGPAYFNVSEVFNPELVTAEAIIKVIEAPGAIEVADFAKGKIFLRSFDILSSSSLCNMKIKDLRSSDFPWPFLVVALARNHSVIIPKGDDVIQAEDRIYVLLPKASLSEFLTFIHPEVPRHKKVIIYGAFNIGESVAASLSEHIRDIVLLEEDEKRAEETAGRLQSVRVINGSASETDILKESGIEAADVFIAVSASDHLNLVSAVLAKKMGAKNTIITTGQPDYLTITEAMGIDVVINPRLLAADTILRLVRGESYSSVTKLIECNAEVLELIPEENSPVTKEPLKNIPFPPHSIVGAIYRGDDVFLASGESQINAGEGVIIFCQANAVRKLHKLFTQKKFL